MNTKLVIALIAVISMLTMYIKQTAGPNLIENFWDNVQFGRRAINVDAAGNGKFGPYQPPCKNTPPGFMTVPGYMQTSPSPRMMNMDGGLAIKYNPAPLPYQAADPLHPISNNSGNCSSNCCNNSVNMNASPCSQNFACAQQQSVENFANSVENFTDGSDVNAQYETVQNQLPYTVSTDTVPVSLPPIDGLAETCNTNPVTYDRLIYSAVKSRKYALGDPIRGDIPITPCNTGWFQASANPSIDLRVGAMQVMGGGYNSCNPMAENPSYATQAIHNVYSGGQVLDQGVPGGFNSPGGDNCLPTQLNQAHTTNISGNTAYTEVTGF